LLRNIINALNFLTIFPVTKKIIPIENIAKALYLFPFIGLILGLLLAGLGFCIQFLFPLLVQRVFILIFWIVLTGALHLDGFIDSCDALFASVTKGKRLQIFKDVKIGAFGLTGAILLLLLKYNSLACLEHQVYLYSALILTPVVGRSALVYVIGRFPYIRKQGLGKPFHLNCGIKEYIMAILLPLLTTACLFFLLNISCIIIFIIPAAWILIELLGRWILKRIPGFTGDVYGAVCELAEIIGLLGLLLIQRFEN
jgi:adenosylcobinamide-GDP ribazoletransferase